MARKTTKQASGFGRLKRAADAVKRLFGRGEREPETAESRTATPATPQRARVGSAQTTPGRVTRREADIPLDVLDRAYTPPLTSSKASFRSDGADHQQDQEFAMGVADDRWKDEDRFTNKSGDPRIGTHRRTYEPGESRTESRD